MCFSPSKEIFRNFPHVLVNIFLVKENGDTTTREKGMDTGHLPKSRSLIIRVLFSITSLLRISSPKFNFCAIICAARCGRYICFCWFCWAHINLENPPEGFAPVTQCPFFLSVDGDPGTCWTWRATPSTLSSWPGPIFKAFLFFHRFPQFHFIFRITFFLPPCSEQQLIETDQ